MGKDWEGSGEWEEETGESIEAREKIGKGVENGRKRQGRV